MSNHVVRVALHTEKWQDDRLEKMFRCAQNVYNVALGKALDRMDAYHRLCDARGPETEEEYLESQREAGFDKETMPVYSGGLACTDLRDEWYSDRLQKTLPSEAIKKVAGTAIQAVRDHAEGKLGRGRPKFKSSRYWSGDLHCIPGCLCYDLDIDESFFRIAGCRGGIDAMTIRTEEIEEGSRKYTQLSDTAANPSIDLIRKKIKGEVRYFAHVTCKGASVYAVDRFRRGTVGIDLGVSTIAAVGPDDAILRPIIDREAVKEHAEKIADLQRVLDRKRRKNNPECFDDQGRAVRGKYPTNTDRAQKIEDQIAEEHRRFSEERKRQHYEIINDLMAMGHIFKIEDQSYREWQEGLFGVKSAKYAAGTLARRLRQKASGYGHQVIEVDPYSTYLSSRCHCGKRSKKTLDKRMHVCKCGVEAQRDLYSANLLRYVNGDDLDVSQVSRDWQSVEPRLREASRESEIRAASDMRGRTERSDDLLTA